ncbi:MAG TPA: hypothetical protein PKV33_03555 [Methanothrix sp.]|nr:hypothetical protein [Methanothrix sp.]
MFEDDADRLSEFARQLSQEDKYRMKCILNKSRISAEMQSDLKAKYAKPERSWTANFVWRVILWGFAERSLIK